jgi:hypothetical protein
MQPGQTENWAAFAADRLNLGQPAADLLTRIAGAA